MDSSSHNEEELAVCAAMYAVFVAMHGFYNMMTAVSYFIQNELLESDDEEDICTLSEEIPRLLEKKRSKTRKRKRVNETMARELNMNLGKCVKAVQRVAEALEAMVERMGHNEVDQRIKREKLEELIETLGWPLKDRVYVVGYFAMKPPLLDVFHGFRSDEDRLLMLNMVLKRQL